MRAQAGFVPHVARFGQGARAVLALHCTMAYSGAWKGFAAAIPEGFTLIAPDMPSHGGSPDWDDASDFSDTVFQASLDCLSEPMDLIGHSFGGVTALRLAVERPDLVRSLTMIEPVFFCIAAMDAPDSVADHDAKAQPFYDAFSAGNRAEAARLFNRMWSTGPKWADLPEQLRAAMTRAIHVVPDTHGFLFDDAAGLLARLERAAMPALLIRGARSDAVVQRTNAGLARRLPHASQTVIDDAGHMAPITHPEAVARVWTDFLARQAAWSP